MNLRTLVDLSVARHERPSPRDEPSALGLVRCVAKRLTIGVVRLARAAETPQEVGACGVKEVIAKEIFSTFDRVDAREAALGAVHHREGDGGVELDDWR